MRCADARRRRARAVGALTSLVLLAGLVACTDDGPGAPSAIPLETLTAPAPASSGAATSPAAPSAPAAPTADLAAFTGQRLDWDGCGGGFQCATLRVPISYADPDEDEVFRLPLVRRTATGSGSGGTLVINPGGPGGSGVSYVRRVSGIFSSSVRSRYDLLGFDPRGVQGSRPSIECVSDRVLDRYIDAATTAENADAQLRDARAFAAGCVSKSPRIVDNVGTRDASRDLEILRSALREKKLNYLGLSYGTLLGITYAETYPDKVGRMVLDGILDPSVDKERFLAGQSGGFERAYRSFLRSCVRSGSCPLGSSVDAAYARTLRLLDDLEAKPLGPAGGRKLTKTLAILALVGSLYEDRTQWAALRQALRSALRGSGYPMLAIGDRTVDRTSRGQFSNNGNEAQYAITCSDRDYTTTVAETAARAERLDATNPIFGEYLAWGDLPCSVWRSEPTRAAHRITTPAIPPILLVGTTRDPATPIEYARSLDGQLGDSTLLTWSGDGHLAYNRGSGCVNRIVDGFLARGYLPDGSPRCNGR